MLISDGAMALLFGPQVPEWHEKRLTLSSLLPSLISCLSLLISDDAKASAFGPQFPELPGTRLMAIDLIYSPFQFTLSFLPSTFISGGAKAFAFWAASPRMAQHANSQVCRGQTQNKDHCQNGETTKPQTLWVSIC